MAARDPEARRRQWREHYARNKDLYYERNVARRARCREIIVAAKNVPCTDCGHKYPPYVMDFDHRDPALKEDNLSKMAHQGRIKRLAEEIAKCDVVCANCHRERTFGPKEQLPT